MAHSSLRQRAPACLRRMCDDVFLNRWLASGFSSSSGRDDRRDEDGRIDFGFQEVPREDKQTLVGKVFSSVAPTYDVMNDLMSGGLHRLWKDRLVESLAPFAGMRHLDVAGGTGDVAFRVLHAIRGAEKLRDAAAAMHSSTNTSPFSSSPTNNNNNSGYSSEKEESSGSGSSLGNLNDGYYSGPAIGSVTVCDINASMLKEGEKKAASQGIDLGSMQWIEGNAESLPFEDNTFDSYTVAFGIRNVTDRGAALREARRVLRPGGRFLCLEFSKVVIPGVQQLYDLYSFNVIPEIGRVVAGDAESYRYLVESIRMFPGQEEFADMVRDAGFSAVDYENLTAGVVAIHSGVKGK